MTLEQAVAACRDGTAQVANMDAHVFNIDGRIVTISGLELVMNPRDEQRMEVLRGRAARVAGAKQ